MSGGTTLVTAKAAGQKKTIRPGVPAPGRIKKDCTVFFQDLQENFCEFFVKLFHREIPNAAYSPPDNFGYKDRAVFAAIPPQKIRKGGDEPAILGGKKRQTKK